MKHPRRTDELTARSLSFIRDWALHIRDFCDIEDCRSFYKWGARDLEVLELVEKEIKLYHKDANT